MPTRLSAISPFGPIFGKELRTTARRKRTYLLRTLYLATLFCVLLMVYLENRSFARFGGGGVAMRAQRDADLGRYFFVAFSMFCVIAMGVISPVLTATAVSAERMARTLHVLLMTPITSWQIISGKLFSRLLVALTLIGLSLPVLAVVRLLGGVELEKMVGVVCLCATYAMFCAAVGLFFSTLLNRAYAVILLSYVTLLIAYMFVPFVVAVSLKHSSFVERDFLSAAAALNPTFNVFAFASGERELRHIGATPGIVVHLVLTAGLVALSGLMLRRRARKEGEAGGSAVAIEPSDYVPFAATAGSLDAAGQPLGMPPPLASDLLAYAAPGLATSRQLARREVSDNPVLWREIRRPLATRRWQAVLLTLLCVGCLLISYLTIGSNNDLGRMDTQIGYAILFNGLWTLLLCVLSATTIAGEKEGDTWTLLLAAPLGAAPVVLGKLAGIGRRMAWPAALVFVHFTVFLAFGVLTPAGWGLILWVILTFNCVWAATGLYLSLRFNKTTTAVILNLLLPVIAYLGVFVALAIAGNLARDQTGRREHWGEEVAWYAPYPYFVSGLTGLKHDAEFRRAGPDYYYTSTRNYWLPGERNVMTTRAQFFNAALTVGACHLILAALLVIYTIARFDKIVGRATQER